MIDGVKKAKDVRVLYTGRGRRRASDYIRQAAVALGIDQRIAQFTRRFNLQINAAEWEMRFLTRRNINIKVRRSLLSILLFVRVVRRLGIEV